MTPVRSAQCPNCGAPIEFALGSSVSKVCNHCSFIVVRTDRDLQTIGKIAELVPTVAPFAVDDEIQVEARRARVSGRVQKDYGAGPWDELSIEFDNGEWAWLARAQGRWYLTSRVDDVGALPAWRTIGAPGTHARLGTHPADWTVMELRQGRVVAARGEFPEPFAPDEVSLYVDLIAAGDAFATLDYETPDSPATLYAGRILPAQAIVLLRAALGPRPEQKTATAKLRCPTCGAPIELADAKNTQRVVCAACGTVSEPSRAGADVALVHLAAGAPLGGVLSIPLGTRGKLRGIDVIVIGAIQRYTTVDDTRYFWLEYLLYSPQGYLWLLEDNGHFTFIRDADPTKVAGDGVGAAVYEGRTFKAFFSNPVRVARVAGEFYWKVAEGDQTQVQDFIAPPKILSCERTGQEIAFSIGEYVEPREIKAAFGDLQLPARVGIAPAQPGPDARGPAMAFGVGLLLMALFGVVLGKPSRNVAAWSLPVRATVASLSTPPPFGNFGAPPPVVDDTSNTSVSPPFVVAEMTTLRIRLDVPETNLAVSTECALVNETTGEAREFTLDAGYYAGVVSGESWSEGSHTDTTYVDRTAPGTYSIHVRTEWEAFSGDGAYYAVNSGGGPAPPTPTMRVVEHSRSPLCALLGLLGLLVPLGFAVFRAWSVNRKRWENSNLIAHGGDD